MLDEAVWIFLTAAAPKIPPSLEPALVQKGL